MSRSPLAGVRILAASQFGAGPFGTSLLADLGAEIVKIEDPESGGDSARYVPPYLGDHDSLYFQAFNRGKKSLTLNFATRTTAEWLAELRGHVPCAPVNSVREALDDEQVRARGMIVELDHPDFGRMCQVARPVKTEGAITRPARAPSVGEHTDELLRDVLGYGDRAIEGLRARGAIG